MSETNVSAIYDNYQFSWYSYIRSWNSTSFYFELMREITASLCFRRRPCGSFPMICYDSLERKDRTIIRIQLHLCNPRILEQPSNKAYSGSNGTCGQTRCETSDEDICYKLAYFITKGFLIHRNTPLTYMKIQKERGEHPVKDALHLARYH